MTLEYPWALILAPLLIVSALLRRRAPQYAPTPYAPPLAAIPPSLRLRLRGPLLAVGNSTAAFFLAFAAARPYTVTQEIKPREARNIILALDLSRSMAMNDFRSAYGLVSRFRGVQSVVSNFLERRHDDRIGLVVFGATAFVQSPLTHDHKLIADLVRALDVGIAGDGTALGDGLGVSIKRAVEVPAESRAVVLLTDGVSTAGSVSPQQAAGVAREMKVTVHTIGIGGDGEFPGRTGREFDEKLLTEIAQSTGGTYSNATSVDQLERIYREIESLHTSKEERPTEVLVEEHFPVLLAIALALYGVTLSLSRTVFRKLP